MRKFILVMLLCMQHVSYATVVHAQPTPPKPKPTTVVIKQETPRQIAIRVSRSRGFGTRQWLCLNKLWTKESRFNPKAHNKHSGAYGIAQFMPQTWKNYKVAKTSNAALQIKYGLRYIERRYGSPCAAWHHHTRYGWY